MPHLNPGLETREKLPPMVAEPEMTAPSLHARMMSPTRGQVKSCRCHGALYRVLRRRPYTA